MTPKERREFVSEFFQAFAYIVLILIMMGGFIFSCLLLVALIEEL